MIGLAVLMLINSGFSQEVFAVEKNNSGPPGTPEIVAHRGFSYVAPENTRAAILLAWRVGSPAAECDVYLTKDQRIMLMHDKSAKRTSGVDIKMEEADSAELEKLEVGSWKDPNYAGEKIPYLEEIIETIPEERTLFIEVKSGPEIVPYLKAVIDQSGKEAQLVIISFNVDVAAAAKAVMPKIPAYWLVSTEENTLTGKPIPHGFHLIQTAAEKGLDGLNLHHAGITAEFAEQARKSNLKLYAWTVDDPQEAQRLEQMGICGITTNRPDYLMKKLRYKKTNPEKP